MLMGPAGSRVIVRSAFGICFRPNVFSIGRCFPAPSVPPLRGGVSQRIGEIASRPETPPPSHGPVFRSGVFSTITLFLQNYC